MSIDPKPPKPMPSADEINAYLEASAARTKLRLPLAKGSAPAAATSAEKTASRVLPVSGAKKLPARQEPRRAENERGAPPGQAENSGEQAGPAEVWRPFSADDER